MKNLKEFIEEIIIPIENYSRDDNNLFLIFPQDCGEQPWIDYHQESCQRYFSEQFPRIEWDFPSDSAPGLWVKGERIKLFTLTGIINSGYGGILFQVEPEGKEEKLKYTDFYYWNPWGDYGKIEKSAQERFIDYCNLGLNVTTARILRRLKKCTPYFLWSFTIDCIEHACNYKQEEMLEIFRQSIFYARLLSKGICGNGDPVLRDSFWGISSEQHLKIMEINRELSSLNSSSSYNQYIGEAINDSLRPNYFFRAIKPLRTAMIFKYQNEYREDYLFPSLFTSDLEEAIHAQRIWHAFVKKEIDWQVSHFYNLLYD